jgi:uncharacterized protein (TIGR03086 family)
MNVDKVLLTGLDTFGSVLELVKPDEWDLPTPCEGWTARALTGHVLIGLQGATAMLQGGDFDRSGAGDPAAVAGDDSLAVFRRREAAARAALESADLDQVMETPMGPMAAGKRLAFPALDLHLHSWDLGRTIGVAVEIPDEVAQFTHAAIDPLPAERVRGGGVFGPEVPAPAGASTTEALIAWAGRKPR